MKYNIYVIITSISMKGGEIMQRIIDFILDIVVQVIGNYLYMWLYKASPSGYWKTLHGVVKRSLIKKI